LKIIKGDILQVFAQAEQAFLLHGVSCQSVLHKGLDKQIITSYPLLLDQHRRNIRQFGTEMLIGSCTFFATETGHKTKDIVNLYQQLEVGRHKQQIDYDYFRYALEDFCKYLTDGLELVPIYIPEGIGSNNAGGDKKIILSIIEEILPMAILVEYKDANIQQT